MVITFSPRLKAETGLKNEPATPMCSSADGSVVPIDTSGVDARYSQANEYSRDDGQDDVAHASLLKTSRVNTFKMKD